MRFHNKDKKKSSNKGKAGSRLPEGLFESWWPKNGCATWLNISPFQEYTQEVYDPDAGEVIKVTTSWFEYKNHWVPSKRRKFVCSAGPYRTEPCYGCAIRKLHWNEVDAIEEETGQRVSKQPPIGQARNFAFGITIAEPVYIVPKRTREGKIRKRKNGEIIYDYIPESEVEDMDDEKKQARILQCSTQFGVRKHWSLGVNNLELILGWNEDLKNRCGNCAGELVATSMGCPECMAIHELPRPLTGYKLTKAREKGARCSECGYSGEMVFQYACPDCGDPREGGITQFDFLLHKDDAGNLSIKDIRLPSEDEDYQKMVQNPYDLSRIFAPEDLGRQKKLLGDMAKHVDPSEGSFTEDYTSSDSDDGDGQVEY
jgi:hypothetical protein